MTSRYTPSPDLENVPAGLDEIEAMIAEDGRPLNDKRKLVHFLKRVWLHIKTMQNTLNRFHQDLGELERRAAGNRGVSGNLDPRQAAQFLTGEELIELAKPHIGAQVDVVNQLRHEADTAHRTLVARLTRIQLIIEGALERTTLDAEVRDQLQRALTALPEPGPAPDPEPVPGGTQPAADMPAPQAPATEVPTTQTAPPAQTPPAQAPPAEEAPSGLSWPEPPSPQPAPAPQPAPDSPDGNDPDTGENTEGGQDTSRGNGGLSGLFG